MRSVLSIIFAGVCLLSPAASRAAVVYVNQTTPGPSHDGASWLAAAHPGDEAWVAAGTYIENLTLSVAVGLYGGFKGTETDRSRRFGDASVLEGSANGSVVRANIASRGSPE